MIGWPVVSGGHTARRIAFALKEQLREIERSVSRNLVQQVTSANRLGDRTQTELRQQLPHVLSKPQEIRDNVLRFASEFGAQFKTLSSNTRWTSIQMTLPRHVAAERYQGSRSKSELLRSQQSGDHNIPGSTQSTINPQANTAAETVAHQRLLRFSQSELPGRACMLDAAQWGCASSARMS